MYFHLMQVCGEYKESEILRLGFFAAQFAPGAHSHVESELINRHEGGYMLFSFLFDRHFCPRISFLWRNFSLDILVSPVVCSPILKNV